MISAISPSRIAPFEIVRRALELMRASWASLTAVVVSKAIVLAIVAGGALALSAYLQMATPEEISPVRRQQLHAWLGIALIVSWSMLSSFQRAVTIAVTLRDPDSLAARDAVARALRDRWARVAVVGAALALVDTVVIVGGMVFLFSELSPFVIRVSLSGLAIWYVAVWLSSRGVAGVVMALVVHEGIALRALSASFGLLRAHRLASVATRALPASIAALSALAVWDAGFLGLGAVLALVEPVVVAIDAVIEAAWYSRLRPSLDARAIASTFD